MDIPALRIPSKGRMVSDHRRPGEVTSYNSTHFRENSGEESAEEGPNMCSENSEMVDDRNVSNSVIKNWKL